MKLFGKREIVFETPDRELHKKAKNLLKQSGVEILESGTYESEKPVCGCGAKLDPRDFGTGGKIERYRYYLAVRPEEAACAHELLRECETPSQSPQKRQQSGIYDKKYTRRNYLWQLHLPATRPIPAKLQKRS